MHTDDEQPDAHVDEGTIHAWLDGALNQADADRVAAHVHACRECRDAVAEARGFIAGASRVVGLLDEEPPAIVTPVNTSAWRFLRVTPARASIAAALIVAAGLTFTRPRAAVESTRVAMESGARVAAPAMAPTVSPAITPEMKIAPRDTLLASAISRRIAVEHPTQVLRATPEPVVTTSAPPAAPSVAMGRETASQVATGMAAQRVASAAANEAPVDKVRASAPGVAARRSGECYRLDGPAAKDWRGVPLPVTIQLGNSVAAGGSPEEPRFGVTAPLGERMIGSYRRIGASVELQLVGETVVTTGLMRGGEATLNAAGFAIQVRVVRVGCKI